MKILLMCMLLVLVLKAAHSDPANNAYPNVEDYEDSIISDRARSRRVICDLMNYGGKAGRSACAANCLSMGKAGGRCHKGVCQCRKTTFSDLKNKRF